MMKSRFSPYQMQGRAEFGKIANRENSIGVNISTFIPVITLHYASVKNTITQKYLALNTEYQNSKIIAVKHNKNIENLRLVKIDNVTYDIIDLSTDNQNYLSYDYVTIIKTKKVGGRR